MRWFFNLIVQLLVAAIVIFALTAVWLVFDGLTDVGEKADVALVVGHSLYQSATSDPPEKARMDHVIQLYNEGQFPFIIVSGPDRRGDDEASVMRNYLQGHGVASRSIIEDHQGDTTTETARNVAGIMKAREFRSVILVTDYYHITRMKLALRHDGINDVQKAHVGKLQKEDALRIAREVVALYAYIGKVYLFPAAEKVKEEAQVGLEKAKADAEKAKKTVDQKIDSMAK